MTARERFIAAAEAKLGMPVLWAMKGPKAFDCSGLFTVCLKEAGGPDLTHIDNAQGIHDGTRMLLPGDLPLAGDAVLYGRLPTADELKANPRSGPVIEHVAIYRADGSIISADGATSHQLLLEVAMKDARCRVRTHPNIHYRSDTPLIVIHRNLFLDSLDGVSR